MNFPSIDQIYGPKKDRLAYSVDQVQLEPIDIANYKEPLIARTLQAPLVLKARTSVPNKDVIHISSSKQFLKVSKPETPKLFTVPPKRPLKPGKKLQQSVYQLSNGSTVGWLPKYDREQFSLMHASPACSKNDVYVAVVITAGKNFDRRQVSY